MSEANHIVAMPVGAIEGDLACRKCGYNLRGLAVEGRCPECGTAVGYSVQGDLLRYSAPDWLRGLRGGMNLIVASVVALIVLTIGTVLLTGVTRGAGVASPIARLLPFGTLAVQAMMYFGTWRLTESDPSGLGEEDYGRIRRFIRIALLIGAGSALLGVFQQFVRLPAEMLIVLSVVHSVTSLVGLVGFCCQLVYLSRLALRLPDPAIARRGKTLAWAIGASYGSILAVGLIVVFLQRFLVGGSRAAGFGGIQVLGCFGGIAGIVLLVSGFMYLRMLERFAKRLKIEEAAARRSWATDA